MYDSHQAIARYGLDPARAMVRSKHHRVALEASARLAREPRPADDCLHASLSVAALPHKAPQPGEAWDSVVDGRRYRFAPGVLEGVEAGVPFGSKARLLLIYLEDRAIRNGGPCVETGLTMYAWANTAHPRSLGGKTYRMIMEQSVRIAGCRLAIDGVDAPIVDHMNAPAPNRGAERPLPKYLRDLGGSSMPESAMLGEAYLRSFRQRCAPLRLSALRQISNSSAAIDLYVWLCHLLPSLREPAWLDWPMVAARFGAGYRDDRQMRRPFTRALELALAVYPEARVDAARDGFTLYPAPPAA